MAYFTITDYQLTSHILSGYEYGLITDTGFLTTSSGITVTATNSGIEVGNLTVFGSLVAMGNDTAKALDFDGAEFNLFVGTGAQVTATGSGTTALDFLADDKVSVTNHGTIHGANKAIKSGSSDTYSTFNLVNTGQISSDSSGLWFENQTGTVKINNDGSIIGASFGIVSVVGLAHVHTTLLLNSGTIQGWSGSYAGSDGQDIIYNSGQMVGDISLNGGTDRYLGSSGSVVGVVRGGDGDDKLVGGSNDDIFLGGNDNDLLVGNGGGDDLRGNDGDDVLKGGSGNDVLEGDAGEDILRGHSDEDALNGGSGIDHLYGGQGDDDLDGGGGDDVLKGGADDDRLAGKTGVDTLTGGRGDDVFVFANASHSGTGGAADTITDFGLGRDVIDLAGLSGGTLDFIGTAGFSSTAGEVRYNVTAAGTSKVSIDLDGDGAADMQIKLLDTASLNAGDFIL